MAAPVVKNFTQALITTGAITAPSDTSIGDLVICFLWSQGAVIPGHAILAGFTQIRSHSHDDGTTDGRLSVACITATAAGAQSYTPYTITNATANQTCGAIMTVTGANVNAPNAWLQASSTLTTNAPPDPASLTGLNSDVLVMAIAAWHVTTAGATAATPMANYTLTSRINGPTGSHVTHLAVATRALTGLSNATEDPAAFGDNVTPNGSVSMTIAIPITATYYVTSAGNDGNLGTGTSAGTAWKTYSAVNAHAFVPGDRVFFAGGQTFTGGGLYIFGITGANAANPITIGSYGAGKATISAPVGSTGAYIYNMGGTVFQDINFTGPGVATANKDGITLYNDVASTVYPYIRVNGCTITGFVNGIAIGGGAGTSGFSDIRIENCTINANSKNGIQTYGAANYAMSNVYVGYCSVYNNTGIAGQTVPTGSGIELGSVNGGTVEFCSAYGNGAQNNYSSGPFGIWCYQSTGVTIQSCESYNNLSGAADGGGFDFDGGCTNCVIQYCYSHGNKGPGFALFQYTGASAFSGNILRYNISEADQGGGIALWGADGSSLVTNSQIYNNTVYSSLAPALFIYTANLSGITVTNNIFLTASSQSLVDYPGTTGVTFSKNNYYPLSGAFVIWWGGTQYGSVAAWGVDATGLQVDPLLTNPGAGGTIGNPANLPTLTAYTITSGSSPMVDVGATVSSPGVRDFYGDALFSGVADIGADEYYLVVVPGQPYRKLMGGIPHMRTGHHSIW